MFLYQDMFNFLWCLCVLLWSICEAIFRIFFPVTKKDLADKTVLITGGGGGLGKQLALCFAKCGARVVLWDIDKDANEQSAALVKAMNLDAYAYTCDCSNEADVKEVSAQVLKEIGPIDILVNNAGILNGKSIGMLTESQIRKTFDVNVLAQFWTIKTFLPSMMEQNEGHIVTIASSAGLNGTEYLTDYSASKFALVGLHESLSLELRTQGFHNIQMTCICPNFINTSMLWYPKTNVPWLVPILNARDVAQEVVDAVREDKDMLILPRVLGKILGSKRILPVRGQLAIYDYFGIGIEPHLQRRKKQHSILKPKK